MAKLAAPRQYPQTPKINSRRAATVGFSRRHRVSQQQIGKKMTIYSVHKVKELPTPLVANAFYLVASGANHLEIYVTGTAASTVRRLLNPSDVAALIKADIDKLGTLEIVDDITARDAMSLSTNAMVLVLDASADSTVNSGAATYAYRQSDASWTKISEAESLDVTLSWANVTGKPTSTAADLDDAVAKRHSHSNSTELGLIGQDANGNLTYNGAAPKIAWDTAAW